MSEQRSPNWQPITFLPQLADMVDGMLEGAEEATVAFSRREIGRMC